MPGDTDATNGNQADTSVTAYATDVRDVSGADYAPSPRGADMTLAARLRITDRRNGIYAQNNFGTTTDIDYGIPVNCVETTDTTVGSLCFVDTTANAVLPGTIRENSQAVLQVFRLRLIDSGPNGIRGDADDSLFEQQGVFVP